MCQTAVYWAPSANGFDASGTPTHAAAGVDVICRWQENYREIIQPDGSIFQQSAIVRPATLVARGGFMVEGTIATVADVTDPHLSGAQEIISVNRTPDFDDELTLIKVSVGQWQRA